MHHLTDISIKNYRSCQDVSLALSDCTPIVGYNNAGKSSMLTAIEWLISPIVLSEGDFFDIEKSISVEGVIDGLDEAMLERLESRHSKKISPYINNGRLRLRRCQPNPGGSKTAITLEVWDPSVEPEDGSAWMPNPNGIDNAIKALFPETIFIGAMQDAAEDAARSKSTTTLGKLLSEFTRPLEEAHGQAIQHAFDAVREKLSSGGAKRVEELQQFDREATAALADFFPGINLHLDIPVPEVRALFKQGTVRISEHGRENIRDFTSLGHGAQRSIQMALIRYLAELRSGGEDNAQRRVLLVEEPELFLHPQAIEQVRLALESLSRSGYQVVYATHSPMMIDRSAIARTRIVRKLVGKSDTRVMPSVEEALQKRLDEADSRLNTLFELGNASEWLFSDRVLLVEGKTERRILPALYQAVTGRSLAADRIALMTLGGCNAIPSCLKVFGELGIEAKALADFDFAAVSAVQHRLVQPDDEDLEACLEQIREMSKADDDIHIGDNGRPTKKGKKKPAQVFNEWARSEVARPVLSALHHKLVPCGIWLWPLGDIEAVLGLKGEKNEREWAEFCQRLGEVEASECVDNFDVIESFVEWMNAQDGEG
ncbi:ATP-dependent nuclease [Halomonas ventosae]|uniref:Putative ATP-dependent endonuclease of OLD family n=1 Tax=Halomonas ventosae TaxID=229007 RepID=A0A2T0VMH4_9GAMM|nr:AAA family ATPase [Halomonas ventosae]PRY71441.1 putative ATP-dependent endonuclease of OLD family [Halomonas ventosae]